ncbi:hypothetical protein DMUE_0406 [Dictyocoela muelleri]|nr:hypothetical protein DMUE_0406 [Dictyocoela muelleri]
MLQSEVWYIVMDLKSFQGLMKLGYNHKTVNHKREFVSNDNTYTNTIEILWIVMKRKKYAEYGIACSRIETYLKAFLFFFRNNLEMKFTDFISKLNRFSTIYLFFFNTFFQNYLFLNLFKKGGIYEINRDENIMVKVPFYFS